jgi:imidazolonepropionase-like amidohydrolase
MHLTVNFAKNLKVLALIGTAFCATAANAQNTVITADKMIDVLTGKTVDYPAVFVGADGRITSIADARTVKWGSDVKHINLSGKTILPGLIDMHVHLDGPADIGGYRGLEFTDSFWGMTAVGSAQAMLKAGFTTVRNVGSDNRNDIGLKQAIENGYATGPRIVPAGYALGATGGHCDSTFLPPSLEKSGKEEGIADSEDELRYQVRRQRKYGAEVIKVCATGGVFSRNTEPGQQQLSERELRVIADEAHQWGLRVAAHAHGGDDRQAQGRLERAARRADAARGDCQHGRGHHGRAAPQPGNHGARARQRRPHLGHAR